MTSAVLPGWSHPVSADVASVGEHALIAWIASIAADTRDADVLIGIGDDAAVLRPWRNHVEVHTTDVQVDGVHFSREYSSAADVGHRALHVNLSDLAAMGAQPRFAMLSLGLPGDLPAVWIAEAVHAFVEAARREQMTVVGGNIARSPTLFLDVTVTGSAKARRVLTRSGARPGDVIYVSGEVGAAAAGLAWLSARPDAANERPEVEAALARYRRPDARVRLGVQVARNAAASACMDTSDGLGDALRQIASASGVGVRVEAEALPCAQGLRDIARLTGADADALVWSGGEDYELLFTVPKRGTRRFEHACRRAGMPAVTRIGTCTKEPALLVVRDGGRETTLPGGFEHFGKARRD